jgi:hypothetical protein
VRWYLRRLPMPETIRSVTRGSGHRTGWFDVRDRCASIVDVFGSSGGHASLSKVPGIRSRGQERCEGAMVTSALATRFGSAPTCTEHFLSLSVHVSDAIAATHKGDRAISIADLGREV